MHRETFEAKVGDRVVTFTVEWCGQLRPETMRLVRRTIAKLQNGGASKWS